MSTFSHVTEAVKTAAQNVADRIHHSATISRVRMMITKEDKLLQKTLAALGTACFEQHKTGEPTDFAPFFEQVEKIQGRLVALQMKLHELYTKKEEEQAAQKPAGTSPEEASTPLVSEPTKSALHFEADVSSTVPDSAEPSIVEEDYVPAAGQIREETIAQLVDVVSEEMGTENYEAEISEDLNQEIISRARPE